MKFRKKPVVIDAHRFMGPFSIDEMPDEFQKALLHRGRGLYEIFTLEGMHFVSPGDWIIKGVKGEFYPCKDEIFRMTYDESGEK